MVTGKSERSYQSPPIIEAVMEIRFVSPASASRVKKAHDMLRGKYLNSEVEEQVHAEIDPLARTVTWTEGGSLYKLSSEDLTQLCHLAQENTYWVQRAPYEGWTTFSQRFATELPVILKAYKDSRVARLGLRYLNRLDIEPSGGVVRYEDYLNFRITHGDVLEPLNAYQWQILKEFPELDLKARVASAVVEPEMPGTQAFMFDIDILCDSNVPQRPDDILNRLEDMRGLKNKIFEAGVTDKARDQYA